MRTEQDSGRLVAMRRRWDLHNGELGVGPGARCRQSWAAGHWLTSPGRSFIRGIACLCCISPHRHLPFLTSCRARWLPP